MASSSMSPTRITGKTPCAAVRAGLLTVYPFQGSDQDTTRDRAAAGSRRGAKIMTFVSDLAEAKVS
jgi:hypothetical protein